MKIFKTKDHAVIKYIFGKIQEYIDKESVVEYNQQAFVKWLRYSIANPFIGIWVCTDDEAETEERILGYIIVMIQQSLTAEHCTIVHLFGDTEEIENSLLETAEKWVKENGINKILTTTFYPKKWKTKGFEVKEHLLVKEV